MPEPIEHHLDLIRQTRRCRPDVEATAAQLANLSAGDYAAVIRELIRIGEDKTLGIACNLCTVNGVRLDPALVAEILKVIEPVTDFAPLYRYQGPEAIAPLLEMVSHEELSAERQVIAGLIAAEMSVLHKADARPVRRALHILEQNYGLTPMLNMMLYGALDLLETGQDRKAPEKFMCRADILAMLPETPLPVVIGGGQTVRRPIPKIGRNDPCHCGSGKKYKKCCLDKERKLLRDASPYAGLTMSQVRSAPQLVDDTQIIEQMRAYELKKLDPADLNRDQLFAAYHRADLFGLRELAFEMLLELDRKYGRQDFDRGHFIDLMESALAAENLALAQKIRAYVPDEISMEPEITRLRYDLLQNTEHLETLESLLRREMISDDDALIDSPLLGLSHAFEKKFPALSIIFARAFICDHPDHMLANETLLGTVRKARIELGIEPWDDPIEDYVDWSYDRDLEEMREADQSQRLGELINDAEAAREKGKAKEKELRQKERELEQLSASLEKEKNQASQTQAARIPRPDMAQGRDKETILRLRRRIDNLKGEISAQQTIRRNLREQLRKEKEKEKSLKGEKTEHAMSDALETEAEPTSPGILKRILIPEYAAAFCKACETVPRPVAAKAVKAVGGFAAADEAIWRHTRPIKRIDACYRIRIGKNYRVLMHWEPDAKIQALDLIPRKALETWIRRNC